MSMKVNKTLSLDVEVVRRLQEEENMSETVEELLRDHYGMRDEEQ